MSSRSEFLRLLRDDFIFFAAFAFAIVRPGAALEPSWYVDALGWQLKEVARDRCKRLIVNMPPRSLKSTLISVIFTAWWLGHSPGQRIICVSYNDSLAKSLSNDFRRLVTDPRFREAFPAFGVSKSKNTEGELRTTRNGYRMATSVGGTLTGQGADMIIVDDPLNAINAGSAAERERVNDWFDTALASRLDNHSSGNIIVVMQRLHEGDLAGHLFGKGGWQGFVLPIRNTGPDRSFPRFSTLAPYIWPADADLMPERNGREAQAKLRADMGDSAFSAQYLQAPLPAEGAIIKAHWFKSCKVLPPARDFSMIVHSWDVANKPAQGADFSVCTIWGVTRDDKYYLIHVFRDRLAFPDLLRKARDLLQLHPPSHLLIEEAANGTALYQELEKTGAFARQLVKPQFDKEARAEAATIAFEQGRVLLPEDPPWRIPYIQELTGFPNSRHDDQVDSTTQFIRFAEARRRQEPPLAMPWGLEKTDPWIDRDFDWQRW